MDANSFREPPLAGDESELLLAILDRTRSVLAWKCSGLDAAGLSATLSPSRVTLGGLLKHLALVEEHSFLTKLFGRDLGPPWDAVDWDADRDWDWHSAATDCPEQLFALWRGAVERSRANVARHNGQADLIRESVDGLVGEDPPVREEA